MAAEQEAARVAPEQEAARIVAEQEAARLAAEQEAARIAAEEEAARIAAEEEAARIAAEEEATVVAEAVRVAAAETEATRVVVEQEAAQAASAEDEVACIAPKNAASITAADGAAILTSDAGNTAAGGEFEGLTAIDGTDARQAALSDPQRAQTQEGEQPSGSGGQDLSGLLQRWGVSVDDASGTVVALDGTSKIDNPPSTLGEGVGPIGLLAEERRPAGSPRAHGLSKTYSPLAIELLELLSGLGASATRPTKPATATSHEEEVTPGPILHEEKRIYVPWEAPVRLDMAEEQEKRLLLIPDEDGVGSMQRQLKTRLKVEKDAPYKTAKLGSQRPGLLGPWGYSFSDSMAMPKIASADGVLQAIASAPPPSDQGLSVENIFGSGNDSKLEPYTAFGLSRGRLLLHGGKVRKQARRNSEAALGDSWRFLGESNGVPVTCMVFLGVNEFLLVGNADGRLQLWDVSQELPVKEVEGEHQSPIVHLCALSGKQSVLAVDASGTCVIHSFNSVPLLKRFNAVSKRILCDDLSGPIAAVDSVSVPKSVLLNHSLKSHSLTQTSLGGISGEMAVDFVAFCCRGTVVVGMITAAQEFSASVKLPLSNGSSHAPLLRWRNVAEGAAFDVLDLLVVSESACMTIGIPPGCLDLSLEDGSQRVESMKQKWNLDSPAVAVVWLDDAALAISTEGGNICLYNIYGKLLERLQVSNGLSYQAYLRDMYGNPVKSHQQSVCSLHGQSHLLASNGEVMKLGLLPWIERVNMLKKCGDWEDGMACALEIFEAMQQGHAIPSPPESLAAVQSFLLEEVDAYVQNSLKTTSRDQALVCAGIAIEVCLTMGCTDALFGGLWGYFESTGSQGAFLEMLELPIVDDLVPTLPPEIMQALVDLFTSRNQPERVERCVLHMDIQSLDLNQVIRLCEQHNMWSALIYIFNRGLGDFVSPAEDLFKQTLLATTSQNQQIYGSKLLAYLRCIVRGDSFPPGRGEISSGQVPLLRCQILAYLLYGKVPPEAAALVTTPRTMASAVFQARHPVLQGLAAFDTPGLLSIIQEAFREWDTVEADLIDAAHARRLQAEPAPGGGSQTALQVFMCSLLNLSSVLQTSEFGSGDIIVPFVAAYVAEGRATAAPAALDTIVSGLCKEPLNERDFIVGGQDLLLKVLKQSGFSRRSREVGLNDMDLGHVCSLAEDGGFFKVTAEIQTALNNYEKAIKAYAKASYKSPEDLFVFAKEMILGGSLDAAQHAAFRDAAVVSAVAFAEIDVEAYASLTGDHFPERIGDASDRLAEMPESNFHFLKRLIQFEGIQVSDTTFEKFLSLHCDFEPEGVTPFLRNRDGFRITTCLEICQSKGCRDAEAFLLERTGDVEGAIDIIIGGIREKLHELTVAIRNAFVEDLSTLQGGSSSNIEVQKVKAAFDTALTVCQRHTTQGQEGYHLWFKVLDSCMQPLQSFKHKELELKNSQSVGLSDDADLLLRVQTLLQVLQGFTERVLQSMASYVPLPDILKCIVEEHGNAELGDFKGTLMGMLVAYSQELNILQIAKRIFVSDMSQQQQRKYRTLSMAFPSSTVQIRHNQEEDS